MPKYIRTKYGTIEINRPEIEREIIKQADTIEELIDKFVFVCEDFSQPQLVIPMNFDYCKSAFKHTEIYGAIWTDKGLIYVAKMNDKGDLELL